MFIPPRIIDNDELKLSNFLNEVLKASSDTKFDIATAFFNISAYALIKNNLDGVSRFRLLLGKVPEMGNEKTLGEVLLEEVREEVEGFELSKEKEDNVRNFIRFLKKENVEVRIYEKQFLHGKTYIFDNVVVVGSSNFTHSGLTYNTELNMVSLEDGVKHTRGKWFEKFWEEAKDFKAELIFLLENSRFGSKEYTPYEIFIKALYELQKEDLEEPEEEIIETRVELTEFQEDAVRRILSRLRKYRAVIVADSVGLGKTWIAKRIIEEFGFFRRKRYMVICPAQLKNLMWKNELKDLILSESILSLEDLASKDFIEKAKKATNNHLNEIELVVVDESHNLRNPLSNRWENFSTLINEHISKNSRRPYILFMTATPINNTLWDLYWQIMLLVSMNKSAFMKENINDLFRFFKGVEKAGDPSMLNDLLNEISIRRTRDYITRNYPDATIGGKKIIFPERRLENMNYELDQAYKGMYKQISDIITYELKMPYYRILKYKRVEKLTQEEEWALNRMIALEGIFRTILLKRLESSVEAFRISIRRHVRFLEKLKCCLKEGKLLSKESYNKIFGRYIMLSDEEIEEPFEKLDKDLESYLIAFEKENYRMEDLFTDIDTDIDLLKNVILEKVDEIKPDEDAKLKVLQSMILKLHKKSQIVVFTYYADTLEYLYENLKNKKEFEDIRIESISGKTSLGKRQKIVKDFANRKIDILLSTDVLSEGQNLQSAQIVINYDLHWNPTRMIQRAGRIDRIGSAYKEIYVYNLFPEDELEELLRLVTILQTKIMDIDDSIGLDQTVLGEKIHPKVFGIIRRMKEKDKKIWGELEAEVFGGGEKFYQPLLDFMNRRMVEELEQIPNGVFSGLEKKKVRGIFFYYKYENDFHYWSLYDIRNGTIITNKTQILDFISCRETESRVIPLFFDKIYEINKKVVEDIEMSYREIEQKGADLLAGISRDMSTKFIKTMKYEIDRKIYDYLLEYPEDKMISDRWEKTKHKLLNIPLTKRRLRSIRKMWNNYRHHKDWKKLLEELEKFLLDKTAVQKEIIGPFDEKKLKLVVIDFIS